MVDGSPYPLRGVARIARVPLWVKDQVHIA